MAEERTIQLPAYGIEITLTGDGGGEITSDLHDACPYCGQCDCYADCDESQAGGFNGEDLETEDEMYERADYNVMVDVVESFVLALAVAGVDVESPAFLEALETTVETIGNRT